MNTPHDSTRCGCADCKRYNEVLGELGAAGAELAQRRSDWLVLEAAGNAELDRLRKDIAWQKKVIEAYMEAQVRWADTNNKLHALLLKTLSQHDGGHSPCNCEEIKKRPL